MDTHIKMVIFSRYNVYVYHVRIVLLTFAFYNFKIYDFLWKVYVRMFAWLNLSKWWHTKI